MASRSHQQLLDASSTFWMLPAPFGCFQLLLDAFNSFWMPSTDSGFFKWFPGAFYSFWRLPAHSGCFQWLLDAFNSFWKLPMAFRSLSLAFGGPFNDHKKKVLHFDAAFFLLILNSIHNLACYSSLKLFFRFLSGPFRKIFLIQLKQQQSIETFDPPICAWQSL